MNKHFFTFKLLLFVLRLTAVSSWISFGWFRSGRGKPSLSVTHKAQEKDKLSPAIFLEDLYQVLNVPMNATKKQLKQAYWTIAFQNHPDRNQTIEALYIYRNASNAYKILGKDSKLRAEYDSKYKTKRYIGLIEQVGTDILQPLTTGVAIPLLNLTIHAIGAKTVPIVQDMLEQSTSALKALLDVEASLVKDNQGFTPESKEDQNPFMSILARTSYAFNLKRYEISLRRKEKELHDAQASYLRMQQLYQTILQRLSNTQENLTQLTQLQSLNQLEQFQLQQTENEQISYYDNIHVLKTSKSLQLSNYSTELRELQAVSTQYNQSIAQADLQIQSLEAQLRLLRLERERLFSSQQMIQATLAMRVAKKEMLQRELDDFNHLLANVSEVYQNYQERRESLHQDANNLQQQQFLLQNGYLFDQKEKEAVAKKCLELEKRVQLLSEEVLSEKQKLQEYQASNPQNEKLSLPFDSAQKR